MNIWWNSLFVRLFEVSRASSVFCDWTVMKFNEISESENVKADGAMNLVRRKSRRLRWCCIDSSIFEHRFLWDFFAQQQTVWHSSYTTSNFLHKSTRETNFRFFCDAEAFFNGRKAEHPIKGQLEKWKHLKFPSYHRLIGISSRCSCWKHVPDGPGQWTHVFSFTQRLHWWPRPHPSHSLRRSFVLNIFWYLHSCLRKLCPLTKKRGEKSLLNVRCEWAGEESSKIHIRFLLYKRKDSNRKKRASLEIPKGYYLCFPTKGSPRRGTTVNREISSFYLEKCVNSFPKRISSPQFAWQRAEDGEMRPFVPL